MDLDTSSTWFLFLHGHLKELFLLLGILLCVLSYCYMHYGRRGRILLKYFSSVPKFPLIGSLPYAIGPPEIIAKRMSSGIQHFGRNYVFWLGSTPILFVGEAGPVVQTILTSSKYIEKGSEYEDMKWIFGNGLVTSNGDIWRSDRKLLNPSFKYQKFDGFLDCFNKNSRVLVKEFKGLVGKATNVHPILMKSTMHSITESVLGNNDAMNLNDNFQTFQETTAYTLELVRNKSTRPWLSLPIIWQLGGYAKKQQFCKDNVSSFIMEGVKRRREELKTAKNTNNVRDEDETTRPLADSLLDTKSDEDIAAHIVTLFGAGFETTASGMNFTLFLLALNPKWQTKVQAELDDIFSSLSDPNNDDLTSAHLSEMKNLEMCIKESLRLYPPVPVIVRHSTEDIQLDDGRIIPKDVNVAFLIRDIHRDPSIYPNPEVFNPERFLPDEIMQRGQLSQLAFSTGPRNCIGMRYAMIQMKATLAHILRNFSLSTNYEEKNMGLVYSIIMEPKPAIEILLQPRP